VTCPDDQGCFVGCAGARACTGPIHCGPRQSCHVRCSDPGAGEPPSCNGATIAGGDPLCLECLGNGCGSVSCPAAPTTCTLACTAPDLCNGLSCGACTPGSCRAGGE
jgi:hypothetical protein